MQDFVQLGEIARRVTGDARLLNTINQQQQFGGYIFL
jgi:hypothetical protein